MKEDVQARIEYLTQALQQSQAQHNAIVGRLEEAKYLLDAIEKKEKVSDDDDESEAGDT